MTEGVETFFSAARGYTDKYLYRGMPRPLYLPLLMQHSESSLKGAIADYNRVRDPQYLGSLCHAPSVNLNFDQSGNASACCYNRRFFLGAYPKNSLKDIWTGPGIERLREILKNNELAEGCDLCAQQLLARNFSGLRAASFDGHKPPPGFTKTSGTMPLGATDKTASFMLKSMEFEISNLCNLECVMCSGFFSSLIRKNRELLEPTENVYDDAFVEQLKPFLPYLETAKFLGGEPLLNPLYFKIWQLILEFNPRINVVITTNATVLTPRSIALFKAMRPTLVVSCDSLDEKVYESIRLRANFKKVRANIDKLLAISRSTGKVMSLVVCPMTINWHTIPDILRFCNREGALIGFNTVVSPKELSLRSLRAEEIMKIVVILEGACAADSGAAANWVVQQNARNYQGMLSQLRYWSTAHG